MLLEDTAEIALIMITAHFSDLTDGQRRIINKQLLCFVHSKIGQIFGWGGIVCLAEDLGQISRTVIHIVCDKVQIDVLVVILDNKIYSDL